MNLYDYKQFGAVMQSHIEAQDNAVLQEKIERFNLKTKKKQEGDDKEKNDPVDRPRRKETTNK